MSEMDDYKVETFDSKYEREVIDLWRNGLLDLTERLTFTFFLKKTIALQIFPLLFLLIQYYSVGFILEIIHIIFIFLLMNQSDKGFHEYVDLQEDMKSKNTIKELYVKPKRNNFWIITKNNKVYGCVAVKEKDNITAELVRMTVDKNTRGKGLAKKLITKLEEFCKKQDYKRIYLTTSMIQYEAISFYKKIGFENFSNLKKMIIFDIHEFIKDL
eukprot:gene8029-12494_t